MIDCRSPKLRRKGEINGPFNWNGLLSVFCYAVIVAACGYILFMTGRHYETVAKGDVVNQASIFNEYKSARIGGH
jgi:hypothetical protein